jgi:hypothetical protein
MFIKGTYKDNLTYTQLQAWSMSSLKMCEIKTKQFHYLNTVYFKKIPGKEQVLSPS